ncbi:MULTISPECIES: hypothetical protein, partial [unclassified Microcoleus]|uniref:hypothetical protein n=1 Tax=unclassified Microcoleus TaxID=2642155 RepID=UPI0025CDD333
WLVGKEKYSRGRGRQGFKPLPHSESRLKPTEFKHKLRRVRFQFHKIFAVHLWDVLILPVRFNGL